MATPGPTARADMDAAAGNLLRLARARRGWSLQQLAEAAGVPPSTVGRIEAGSRQPSLTTLYRLLAAADFDLRVRLEPYDDHDDVLDALHARRKPEEQEQYEETAACNAELFRQAGEAARGLAVG